MENNVSAVASPCINHCVLNDSDVCVGCYRTLQEIGGWSMTTDEEKRQIPQRCEQRRPSGASQTRPSSWRAPAE